MHCTSLLAVLLCHVGSLCVSRNSFFFSLSGFMTFFVLFFQTCTGYDRLLGAENLRRQTTILEPLVRIGHDNHFIRAQCVHIPLHMYPSVIRRFSQMNQSYESVAMLPQPTFCSTTLVCFYFGWPSFLICLISISVLYFLCRTQLFCISICINICWLPLYLSYEAESQDSGFQRPSSTRRIKNWFRNLLPF